MSESFENDTIHTGTATHRINLPQILPELSNFDEDGTWRGIPRILYELTLDLHEQHMSDDPEAQEVIALLENKLRNIFPNDDKGWSEFISIATDARNRFLPASERGEQKEQPKAIYDQGDFHIK